MGVQIAGKYLQLKARQVQTITFICSLSIDSSGLVSKEILGEGNRRYYLDEQQYHDSQCDGPPY